MISAVIPFTGKVSRFGLSLRDRMEIALWQSRLCRLGYDRVVIHERNPGDPPELESFLSIYREGEVFAQWGLSRRGDSVLAWHSVTGADVGCFDSVEEAFAALFLQVPDASYHHRGGQVIRAFSWHAAPV